MLDGVILVEGLKCEVEEVVLVFLVLMWWLLKVNRLEWGYGVLGCVGLVVFGFMNLVFVLVISNVFYLYYYMDYDKMKKEILKYLFIFVGFGGIGFFGYFI